MIGLPQLLQFIGRLSWLGGIGAVVVAAGLLGRAAVRHFDVRPLPGPSCHLTPACDPVRYSGGPVGRRGHAASLTVTRLVFSRYSFRPGRRSQPPPAPEARAEPAPPTKSPARRPPAAAGALETTPDSDQIAGRSLSPVKQNILIPTPGPTPPASPPPAASPSDLRAEAVYTAANQVQARSSAAPAETGRPEDEAPAGCPAHSTATFDLIPIEGEPSDRPDSQHADLNISLRGFSPATESPALKFYYGATDADAPQFSGLFQPNRAATIKRGYRVNDWIWDSGRCGGRVHGCAGGPIELWGVTMIGLAAAPGEPLTIPERQANIYQGGYKAMVLYAAERQLTLGYIRRDNVAGGYVVHIKDICVDPNLLALYRDQIDPSGRRRTGLLPALRNDQILGTALYDEVKVAIRDNGSFMDPRSSKDWWR